MVKTIRYERHKYLCPEIYIMDFDDGDIICTSPNDGVYASSTEATTDISVQDIDFSESYMKRIGDIPGDDVTW